MLNIPFGIHMKERSSNNTVLEQGNLSVNKRGDLATQPTMPPPLSPQGLGTTAVWPNLIPVWLTLAPTVGFLVTTCTKRDRGRTLFHSSSWFPFTEIVLVYMLPVLFHPFQGISIMGWLFQHHHLPCGMTWILWKFSLETDHILPEFMNLPKTGIGEWVTLHCTVGGISTQWLPKQSVYSRHNYMEWKASSFASAQDNG